METMTVKITGTTDILFHNERLADPFDPYTREIAVVAKRKKTDEGLRELAALEWRGGFYEIDGYAVVPAKNILGMLRDAGRLERLGTQIERGVFTDEAAFRVHFAGKPVVIEAIKGNPAFIDCRCICVNRGSRVTRTRPRVPAGWSLEVSVAFDPETVTRDALERAWHEAGRKVGLCDARRIHQGRFRVDSIS